MFVFPQKGDTPKVLEAIKSRNDSIEVRRILDLKAVLATQEGRRTLWWFLSECGMYREEGPPARRVGLKLLHNLWYSCPDAYFTAEKEYVQDVSSFDAQLEALRQQERNRNADTRGTGSRP